MKLKPGVSLLGLTPQAAVGMAVAESVFARHGYEAIITSGSEGVHKAKSKHYIGNAFDLRVRNFGPSIPDPPHSTVQTLVQRLQEALPGFDVILEVDHVHVEWDPVGK